MFTEKMEPKWKFKPMTLPTASMAGSERGSTHLVLLRQLGDLLHITLVSNDDERLQTGGVKRKQQPQTSHSHS